MDFDEDACCDRTDPKQMDTAGGSVETKNGLFGGWEYTALLKYHFNYLINISITTPPLPSPPTSTKSTSPPPPPFFPIIR